MIEQTILGIDNSSPLFKFRLDISTTLPFELKINGLMRDYGAKCKEGTRANINYQNPIETHHRVTACDVT